VQLNYSENKPSIVFRFKECFVKFMNEANDSHYSNKEVLERLANDYSMRIVETDSYDDDRVGFEKSAIYNLPL
jgi:hypothetical protein